MLVVSVVSGMGTSTIIVDKVTKQLGSEFIDLFMRDPLQECPGETLEQLRRLYKEYKPTGEEALHLCLCPQERQLLHLPIE